MKRIERFKSMNARDLSEEFYYFDVQIFIDEGDDHEKVIKKIMRWLNKQV